MIRATSNKPLIRCPYCKERIEAEQLLRHRKYRNKFGLDVFECPQCRQRMKFEPTQYLRAREAMDKGAAPSGATIAAVKPDERLPSEGVPSADERRRARWRQLSMTLVAAATAVVGIYLALR
jgi:hypothetical protein